MARLPEHYEKQCKGCGEVKPHTEFHRQHSMGNATHTLCKVCSAARVRNYYRANPDKVREMRQRRLQQLRVAGGSHTRQQWLTLCAKQGNRCARCGETRSLTRDHVIPVSEGGSDNIGNIQGLCKSCNSSKHTESWDFRTGLAHTNTQKRGKPRRPAGEEEPQ